MMSTLHKKLNENLFVIEVANLDCFLDVFPFTTISKSLTVSTSRDIYPQIVTIGHSLFSKTV